MSKKIKITEDQLKRLVSSKQQVQEQEDGYNQETMEQSSEILGGGSKVYFVAVEMNDEDSGYNTNNEYDLTNAAVFSDMEVAMKYRQALEDSFGGDESKHAFISTMQLNATPKMDNEMPNPPSEEETQDNQVYESIKANFKRFL